MTDLLTPAQVAHRLGISRQRVSQLMKAGRLPAVKVGPYWLIEATALAAFQPKANGRPRKPPPTE